ncbi:p-loop containing nucleoside triphosphate hydrolase protein [Mycena sanguinolenta]|uniref:p-loop containing nucleoside triphosphate hydrolase protein n=1 Tax=Mycena sanguinolenta TaxID=230812 RepID=A0A8H7CYE4_9AGAR|nr:p-loop containing nucleoside triphosphate hydrolase protein [Mycena sanguinolenta]
MSGLSPTLPNTISLCLNDSSFGPKSLCRSFDFTLAFEASILLIIPPTIFVCVATPYIWIVKPWRNFKANLNSARNPRTLTILFSLFCLNCTAILSFVSWQSSSPDLPSTTKKLVTAALALTMISSLLFAIAGLLAIVSKMLAFLLALYQLISLILQLAPLRTFMLYGSRSTSKFFLASFASLVGASAFVVISLSIPGRKNGNRLGERDGLFNHLFVLWALPLMWKGRKKDSEIDYELEPEMESTELYRQFKIAWDREIKQHPSHPLLARALFRAFSPTFLSTVPPAMIRALVQVLQPLLVNAAIKFISSYARGSRPEPSEWGWALAGVFALVFLTLSGATGLYYYSIAKAGGYIRGVLVEALFRKALVLRADSATDATGEDPMNLMSSDIERITTHLDLFHQIWSSFIIIVLDLYILHTQLGLGPFVAALPIILLVIITTPLLSRKIGPLEGDITALADKRVRLLTSIFGQVKGIKLAALEREVEDGVKAARMAELSARKRFWDRFAIVVSLASSKNAYATLTIISASLYIIGQGLPAVTQAYVSVQRIERFLSSPESKHGGDGDAEHPEFKDGFSQDIPKTTDDVTDVLEQPRPVFLHLESSLSSLFAPARGESDRMLILDAVRIAWGEKVVLDRLEASICLEQHTMVIGRVASGKSTLLVTLLGQTNILAGRISFPAAFKRGIAYCSQVPWIQDSLSVRENILFASAMDPDWYEIVTVACGLDVDLRSMPRGDLTLARRLSGGQKARVALARAVYSRLEILVLDDVFAALDPETSSAVFNALFGNDGLLRGKTVVSATNQFVHLKHSDWIIALHGRDEAQQGTYIEFLASNNATGRLIRDNIHHPIGNLRELSLALRSSPIEFSEAQEEIDAQELDETELPKSSPDPLFEENIFTLYALNRLVQNGHLCDPSAGRNWHSVALRASANLHAGLFSALMNTAIEFFSTTHPGQIISRFSQDIFILDELFPISFYDFGYQFMRLVGSGVLMIVSVPYLAAVVAVVVGIAYVVQKFYLSTAKRLRHLDLSSKAPLYTLFQETLDLNGLLIIRAALAENHLVQSSTLLLAQSQRPFYLNTIASVWFSATIGVMTATVNTAIVILAIATRRNINPGLLAVGLTQAVSLQDTITLMLNSWTQLEVSAVALERNLEYSSLASEQGNLPAANSISNGPWISRGEVKFHGVFARYTTEEPPVLRGISFHAHAGSKVAIVGRTGGGKSTLLMALLRAVLTEGQILIDGINIQNVTRRALRKSITVIAQDPFVLAGTVRQNVDIAGQKTDAEIWAALEAVQLKPSVTALEGGLDHELTSSGRSLSQGQLQLLAMARALLDSNKLAIFDEPTASVDPATDIIIQNVIRSSFQDCTILAIVHRLDNVMDFDQVLVLDAGQVVERGKPSELVQNEDSIFKQLRNAHNSAIAI